MPRFLLSLVLLTSACLLPHALQAQPSKRFRPQPNYVQLGTPDQKEGVQIMQSLRSYGIQGDYYLEFELKFMPRRGDSRVSKGCLWGGRRGEGAYTRLELTYANGEQSKLLIFTGPNPALWSWAPGEQAPRKLNTADFFIPLGDTLLTPFDLQMPYLFWEDYVYEGISKTRGRPAYRFLLYPPLDISIARPQLAGVRISVDSQYKALVESSQISETGEELKKMALLELKKWGEQWLVRSIDVTDGLTHDKTRLTIIAAALGLSFSDGLFLPDTLPSPLTAPEAKRIDRF